MKYEYAEAHYFDEAGQGPFETWLNMQAEDGWRVVHVAIDKRDGAHVSSAYLLLERQRDLDWELRQRFPLATLRLGE